ARSPPLPGARWSACPCGARGGRAAGTAARPAALLAALMADVGQCGTGGTPLSAQRALGFRVGRPAADRAEPAVALGAWPGPPADGRLLDDDRARRLGNVAAAGDGELRGGRGDLALPAG